MIFRRLTALLALVAAAAPLATAQAQDWKAKYKEIVLAPIPAENASGVSERFGPFVEYLSKELGVPVKLRVANDYAAVIEGQRAGNIHIAMYGPASYARAYLTGVKTTPFAIDVNEDGTKGYYSVLYVKKDSPFKAIEDLKGKNLCLVDPNSTSGNNVPLFSFNKLGIEPSKFFANVINAGSHENAVIAVAQGTCDAGSNWWNSETESNLHRMERKGMEVAGKKIAYADFRVIFKSEQIVNSPVAYLDELPDELKAKIRAAYLTVAAKAPDVFKKMTDGKAQPWEAVDHKAYLPVVDLVQFVDTLRKKK